MNEPESTPETFDYWAFEDINNCTLTTSRDTTSFHLQEEQ